MCVVLGLLLLLIVDGVAVADDVVAVVDCCWL